MDRETIVFDTRPDSVRLALQVLWASLLIGLFRTLLEKDLWKAQLETGASLGFVLFTVALVFAFIIFLGWAIGRRKNWARWTFAIFFWVGIPFSILPLFASLKSQPVSGVLGIAQAVGQFYVTILLFQSPAKEWFKGVSAARTQETIEKQ